MTLRELLNRRGALPVILAAALAVFLLFDIGGRSISSPDEGRYIEIPREMVMTGDYVLPRLDGILYFEKPPLFYWAEAGAIKLLGISEWSMRLVPALLGLFGCLLTYGMGRRFYGRETGVVAGAVLATSLLYYGLARFVIIDMMESVLMSAALFAFLLSAEEDDDKRAIWWSRAGHVAAALAVLSKGLIGVVLPGLVGLVWIALTGRWSFVRRALCPSGIAIFLLIAVPWHVMAAMRNHDFLWFYFVHEHLMRFTTTVHRRNGPIVYFIPVLAAGFLPWTGYLWHAVKETLPHSWKARGEHPVELYFLLWAAIIFTFFSISDSKLPTYILPIFPPLALLVARAITRHLDGAGDALPAGRWVFVGFYGFCALATPIAYMLPQLMGNPDIGPYMVRTAPLIYSIAVLFGLGALAAIFLPSRFGLRGTLAAILVTSILGWTGVSLVASRADPNSAKPVIQAIEPYRLHDETVASYGTFFYDLPVYLRAKVPVVGNIGEFEFGTTQEDVSAIVPDPKTFAKTWNGPDLVFMLVRPSDFASMRGEMQPRHLCIIAETDRAIGVANRQLFDKAGKSGCRSWYDADVSATEPQE